MNFLLLLVTILCAISNCLALRNGAPSSACSSLMPVHGGTSLQEDNAPYTVNVDKIGQNKVRVTITSPIGDAIKGFMLQARSSNDRSKFIAGEFKSNDESKTVDCFDQKRSSLTHTSPSAKSQVATEWTATSPVNEDVIFRATVAKSYAVYWKDIDSKPVSMRTAGEVTSSPQRNSNSLPIYDACFKSKGCIGLPQGCIDRGNCEVLFTYERSSNRGIRFTMHGLLESLEYMAVGLSDDDQMGEDYVTECFRDSANNGKLRYSWNGNGKSNGRTTETNDNYDFSVRNGLTTCSWNAPYTINAFGRTYDLANNKYHILLARGPVQNNRLRYHSSRSATGNAVDLTTVGAVSGGGQVTPSSQRNSNFLSIYDACFKSKGCFGLPQGCTDKGDCEVLLTYERSPNRGVRFTMHGLLESSEYMAVGLSDDDQMGEDYVTECFRDSVNNNKLRNSWNGNGKSNGRTTETNDNYDFSVRNGLTTCSWNAPYTINAFGRTFNLANNNYHILLAKGPVQDNRLRYHTSRLASRNAVNFTTVGAVSGGGVTDSVKVHGAFMVTGWIGFVSIAILLARHFKNVWETSTLGGVKIWFALHRGFMLTALVFIIIAFIVIFVHKNGWNYQTSNPHAILGCIATCLGLLNPIMALFRPAPDHPKRVVFNWLHFIVGNGAHLFAVITIFFAVKLPSSGLTTSFYWVMAIFVIVHLLFHFLYQVHTWTDGKKKNNELSMNEMNGARGTNVQNGHNSQAKKITGDVFRILLLGIYCIFLLAVLIALYALIGSA